MTTVVKDKVPLVIPAALQRRAGMAPGDYVEMKATRGVITIVSKAPTAEDEYTPAQRRAIKAEIAKGRKGPYHGPFKSGAEVAAYLKTFQRSTKPERSQ